MLKRAKWLVFTASLALALGSLAAARGDEPKSPESKCQCPERAVPILSNIPYVSRLFRNVGIAHEPGCSAATCKAATCQKETAPETLERIGIDFELCPKCPETQFLRFGPIELAWAIEGEDVASRVMSCKECPVGVCPALAHQTLESLQLAASKAAACSTAAACETRCCCAQQCCAVKCAAKCAGKCAGQEAAEPVHHTAACHCADHNEQWDQIIELASGKAAAEAALEAREEHSELLDALVEMATKTAALEAKLEAHAENAKLVERLVEMATENARLKSQIELADAKIELLKTTLPVAMEKELLARRVAELEERLAASDVGIRTAKKPASRKAR